MVLGAVQKLLFDKIIFLFVAINRRFFWILNCHERLINFFQQYVQIKNTTVEFSAATASTNIGDFVYPYDSAKPVLFQQH